MVINKKAKMYIFVEVLLVEIVFVASSYDLTIASITSSHVITKSSKIFPNYLPCSQVYVVGF